MMRKGDKAEQEFEKLCAQADDDDAVVYIADDGRVFIRSDDGKIMVHKIKMTR